jgi:peptide/nickel transport system substrate-binding protein
MKFILSLFLSISLYPSTLNLDISSNPSRINPILSTDSISGEISQWIFNGLFKYDKDGNIITDLAKSYYFKTPTTLIVKLKQDVKWHDGVSFNADDVIFTYNSIISPKVFTSIKSNFDIIKSVKKINQFTLKIEYKKPYFKALEIWLIGLLPKHILKNEKNLMTSRFNKHPIGTGPYKLKTLNISSNIILTSNDNYFQSKPNIDTISYKFIPDTTTSFYTLKQKKLDLSGLTPIQIDRQIDNKFKDTFTIFEKPSFSYEYMGFNLTSKKFKDLKIRKALSLAIDRQEIIDILFFGHGKICTGPFLPNTFAFNKDIKAPTKNIKKAKKLLQQMGYDKKHPFEFQVITNANNSLRVNAAQIIQYQLQKIGVKMKIRIMEWQAFLNTIVTPRNFDAIILGWGLSLMPDAKPLWHSSSDKKGGFNLVGYYNHRVDKLIEQGEIEIDKIKLSKIYKKIFQLISDDLPYLFLYIPNSITVINKDIKNVSNSLIGVTHNEKDWIKQ